MRLPVLLDKFGQDIILTRGNGGRRENFVAVRDNLFHGFVSAKVDTINSIDHVFRRKITDIHEVVSLVEKLHDPVHLGIKRNRNGWGLRQESKNRAMQSASDEIVGIAQYRYEFPPSFDCWEMNPARPSCTSFCRLHVPEVGNDAFIIAER